MKRSYILLIFALVAVVLAFTYAKSYLSRLESDDARIKQEISQRQIVDSLRLTYQMLANEHTEDLQNRYDSLLEESDALIYALESQLDLYINSEFDPAVDSMGAASGDSSAVDMAEAGDSSIAADADSLRIRTAPEEYEIYVTYLEKALALPKDLSSYEKKVATKQIRRDLMNEFELEREELNSILVKVRTRNEVRADSANAES